MKLRTATWYRHNGTFRMFPPEGLINIAEFYFAELEQLRRFADACGWMLKEMR